MRIIHPRVRGARASAVAVALAALAAMCSFIGSCAPKAASQASPGSPRGSPPAFLLGEFEDDYGIRYSISTREWRQEPSYRYHVIQWNAADQYMIARNDDANPSEAGLYTRIDWMELPAVHPVPLAASARETYQWAFCMSVYDGATAAEAEAGRSARRDSPMTGCNGHPFSRMRRRAPD